MIGILLNRIEHNNRSRQTKRSSNSARPCRLKRQKSTDSPNVCKTLFKPCLIFDPSL